jgi:copper chaperone CopZ
MEDCKKYVFGVTMSCGGCSGAVARVLKKMEGWLYPPPPPRFSASELYSCDIDNGVCFVKIGVYDFTTDLEAQKVTVFTKKEVELSAVLETIKKTGKAVTFSEEAEPTKEDKEQLKKAMEKKTAGETQTEKTAA